MGKRQSNGRSATTQKQQPSEKAMKVLFAKLRSMGMVITPKNGHWHIRAADGTFLAACSGSPKSADNECKYIRQRLRNQHGIEVE